MGLVPSLADSVGDRAEEEDPHPRETSGLARRILPQIGEEEFPVFSFIDKSELGKMKPDPA